MTLLVLESDYGEIVFEVDETDEGSTAQGAWDGLTVKGDAPSPESSVLKGKFSSAMRTLSSFSKSVQSQFADMDVLPSEVKVAVGLKFSASSGFVIAKAGGETVINVTMTWSPDKK